MLAIDNDIRTVADVTRVHARLRPDKTAFHFEGARISYAMLDRRANQVAHGLAAERIAPGTRIAILAKNAPPFFELWFGACKAGAVLVPVNFRLAAPEAAYVVDDAEAELLFVGADYYALVETIEPALKTVRRIVALDGNHPRWPSYEEWRARQATHDPDRPIDRGDVAIQMYTSGTTGHPKGAQLTHANLLTLLPTALREWGRWRDDDVSLVCMPLFHIGGSGWALIGLYRGLEHVLCKEFDPPAILATIPRYRVSKTIFVPAMLLFLLQAPQCRDTDFSSLDLIFYGASPAPLDLVRQALKVFGCGLAQVYGLTETTGAITYLPPEDHGEHAIERMTSCGKPMGATEIKIVDTEGKELPPRAVGEIISRSPQNMKGYWHLPEASARTIRGGWLYTGDAGYKDEDGYLYIYDRVKDMIVSGGENIYPAEIESAIFGHPAVADVAVIGVPDRQWGEAVKAIVVKKPGADVTAKEIIDYARERIGGYKVPRSIDFAETLPRNPSGKILKRELRRPYWEGRERQVN
jgi:long-chain acyl-CoA synthetase